MAAEFNTGVLTNKGLALLAKWQAGECTPELTRAVAGSGSYSTSDVLTTRTALKSQKLSVSFSAKTVQNSATLLLRFILSNESLTAGFSVTEIGIYATDPDEGEILYSIATTADESHADYLPAYNGTYPSTIVFNYQIEVANADTVTITAGTGGYAPADDFYTLQEDVANLEDQADDNTLAIRIITQGMIQLEDAEPERGIITLANSKEFPYFNSSLLSPTTVALEKLRATTNYMVLAQIIDYEGGTPGEVEISDRLTNGFKIGFTGSATQATIAYEVSGGAMTD